MAATNYTPIQLYYSSTTTNVPLAANLASGELAINITDGKLFYKDNAGTVQTLATKGAGTIGGSTTQVQYNNSGALAGSSNLTFNGTTLTTNDFTDLSLTSGRVTYAGTGGNLIDSANLTFNGTTLTANTLNLTNALGATYGGTGQSSYVVGDLLYASSTTALSKLADVATGNALISGGVGVSPAWGKIALTTHISGVLPTANGGTNLSSFTANGVVYASSTSALTTGSSLVFDGTNLGVGTASPDSSSGFVFATTNGTSGSGFHAQFNGTTVSKLEAVTGGTNLTAEGARAINFYTNSILSSTVDSAGNFGIGTPTPARKFHVYNTVDGQISRFTGGATSTINIGIFGNSTAGFASIGTESNHPFRLYTNNIDRLYINTSGLVSIGRDTPYDSNAVLTLEKSNVASAVINSTTNSVTLINVANGLTSTAYTGTASNHQFGIYTNSSLRVAVNTDGSVGIGTTAPQAPFGGRALQLGNTTDSRSVFTLQSTTTGQGSVYFSDGTTGGDTYRGFIDYAHTEDDLIFGTAATPRARFNNSGAFVFAGGTTTANGIGITFPATQSASSNANTLDDYEEGTWTPEFKGSVSNPTTTYTQQAGRYIKIGRMVYWGLAIRVNTTSGGSGILYINAPFNILSTGANTWGGVVAWNGTGTFTGQNPTSFACINNSNAMYLHTNSTTMATSDVTVSQLANGSNIEASGMFETD